MSDQPSSQEPYGNRSEDREGGAPLTPDQAQPEDTLIGGEDPLDVGYETPDRAQGTTAFGVTAEEQRSEETLEQRIRQEEPEEGTAYGAPDDEGGLDALNTGADTVGGDDPDAIPADQDFLGSEPDLADLDEEDTVGELLATEDASTSGGEDEEKDLVAQDTHDAFAGSPEEQAMHYTGDQPNMPDDDGDEDLRT